MRINAVCRMNCLTTSHLVNLTIPSQLPGHRRNVSDAWRCGYQKLDSDSRTINLMVQFIRQSYAVTADAGENLRAIVVLVHAGQTYDVGVAIRSER